MHRSRHGTLSVLLGKKHFGLPPHSRFSLFSWVNSPPASGTKDSRCTNPHTHYIAVNNIIVLLLPHIFLYIYMVTKKIYTLKDENWLIKMFWPSL